LGDPIREIVEGSVPDGVVVSDDNPWIDILVSDSKTKRICCDEETGAHYCEVLEVVNRYERIFGDIFLVEREDEKEGCTKGDQDVEVGCSPARCCR
jgi:hypothetical protein